MWNCRKTEQKCFNNLILLRRECSHFLFMLKHCWINYKIVLTETYGFELLGVKSCNYLKYKSVWNEFWKNQQILHISHISFTDGSAVVFVHVSSAWLRIFPTFLACVNARQSVCIAWLLVSRMEQNINMKQKLLFLKVIKQEHLWMAKMGRKYYKYEFHYIWEHLIQGK